MKIKNLSIHYDCDGVLRNWFETAMNLFFKKYPQYQKFRTPSRGWDFINQLIKSPESPKIAKLMFKELLTNTEMCYRSFLEAEPLVSQKEWWDHINKIKTTFSNPLITISTHQYCDVAREATMKWLHKNNFTRDDKINILFTGQKDRYGAHYLLDDKPATIENFHKPFEKVGVLKTDKNNLTSNSWYLNKRNLPTAETLNEYFNIIEKMSIKIIGVGLSM